MTPASGADKDPTAQYLGRILVRPYASPLKRRVVTLIKACRAFDHTGAPAIPYIAAWQAHDNIWYEFAGRRFLDCLIARGIAWPKRFAVGWWISGSINGST
jgi:hypothetical protein